MNQKEIKKALGAKAAQLVEEGMLVGLGSGSTSACFIESLGLRCQNGLKITAVSSSIASMELAKRFGIPVLDMEKVTSIDLTIDGADEIDPQKRLIKGGGGAHVREKIVASSSKKMVVIADETKLVQVLGNFGLPVEILPFGARATAHKLQALGYEGKWRPGLTDNGNLLYDIHTPKLFLSPEKMHEQIIHTPGVVDTGFFFNLATTLLIGYADGRIESR